MDFVSTKDAKKKFSAILSSAGNGETTIVTNFGRPVAVIAPFRGEGQQERANRSNRPAFEQALLSLPYDLDF